MTDPYAPSPWMATLVGWHRAPADGTLILWSIPSKRQLLRLSGHKTAIRQIAFGPKATMVSRDSTGAMITWSTRTGKNKGLLRGTWQKVEYLLFTPDGSKLITASKERVELRGMPSAQVYQTLKGHRAAVCAMAVSADGRTLATGDRDGVIILWNLAKGEQLAQLFDAEATGSKARAVSFKRRDTATGRWTTYTQPCGAPIPPGAICVCNCVPGRLTINTTPTLNYRPRNRGSRFCTCNKVCVCNTIPICQAHRLLDADQTVRHMAEQMLLLMGRRELAYMKWAASQSAPQLRQEIDRIIGDIEAGAQHCPDLWPSRECLLQYLAHEDHVVTLVAAQLLKYLAMFRHVQLRRNVVNRIESIIRRAQRMSWHVTNPQYSA